MRVLSGVEQRAVIVKRAIDDAVVQPKADGRVAVREVLLSRVASKQPLETGARHRPVRLKYGAKAALRLVIVLAVAARLARVPNGRVVQTPAALSAAPLRRLRLVHTDRRLVLEPQAVAEDLPDRFAVEGVERRPLAPPLWWQLLLERREQAARRRRMVDVPLVEALQRGDAVVVVREVVVALLLVLLVATLEVGGAVVWHERRLERQWVQRRQRRRLVAQRGERRVRGRDAHAGGGGGGGGRL